MIITSYMPVAIDQYKMIGMNKIGINSLSIYETNLHFIDGHIIDFFLGTRQQPPLLRVYLETVGPLFQPLYGIPFRIYTERKKMQEVRRFITYSLRVINGLLQPSHIAGKAWADSRAMCKEKICYHYFSFQSFPGNFFALLIGQRKIRKFMPGGVCHLFSFFRFGNDRISQVMAGHNDR